MTSFTSNGELREPIKKSSHEPQWILKLHFGEFKWMRNEMAL
jgi:hypothetical protein